MTMGWTEPPPLTHSASSSFSDGGSPTSPMRAPTADRRLSQAIPDFPYRTEAASKRFSRKFSFRPGWMEPQSPTFDVHDTHDDIVTTTFARFEGFHPTASTATATATSPGQRSSIAGPSEATLENIRRMSTVRRVSCYSPDPTVNQLVSPRTLHPPNSSHLGHTFHSQNPHGLFNTNVDYNKERPLPTVEIHLSGDTDHITPRMSRISHRKMSSFTGNIPEIEEGPLNDSRYRPSQVDPKALSHALAVVEGTAKPCEEKSLPGSGEVILKPPQQKSSRRRSQFMEAKIPEIQATPMINFHSGSSQPDSKALNDALAALEGGLSTQTDSHVLEENDHKVEVTPRKMKRMSTVKRVSVFLENDIPEVGETAAPVVIPEETPVVPPKSRHRRKPSVEYALAALEAPTPTQANMGRPRRPDPAIRSRKTKSMFVELGDRGVTHQSPETRSGLDAAPFEYETKFESTSRKLKRLSWDVMGRALPQPRPFNDFSSFATLRESSIASNADDGSAEKPKRSSWLPTARDTTQVPPFSAASGTATSNFPWDQQPRATAQHERRIEPVPRKHNKNYWYSMDPAVAEIQCGPRKEYGLPAPWLEDPTGKSTTSKSSKRASRNPLHIVVDMEKPTPASPHREISPATRMDTEEKEKESVDDAKLRKKTNRMSRLVSRTKYTQEVFPQLSGPLNSHPAARASFDNDEKAGARAEIPAAAKAQPQKSRLRRFGLQFGRLFR